MISVNRQAAAIAQQMIKGSGDLGLNVFPLNNGATVIDAGVKVVGSREAGRLFSCACLGGLGRVSFTQQIFNRQVAGPDSSPWISSVAVAVDLPHVACMASQYAGWSIKLGEYFAIGSGPARALYAGEAIFQKLDYRDQSETAVLMLETRELPDEGVAAFIAEKCFVKPERLILMVAPTASLVGSIQIAARAAETGLHKLVELGFDVRRVSAAFGLCPLAPVAADDLHAIGRTNDAILYGSRVWLLVRAGDEELSTLVPKIPSDSSPDYGKPFHDLFMQCKGDFYRIDPLLFSPAEVTINNLNSGKTFHAGRMNPSLIHASFFGN